MPRVKPKEPEKVKYLMTPDEFQMFKSACNPGRSCLVAGSHSPMPLSAEERSIVFWAKLGQKYGFDPMTVEPSQDEGDSHGHFYAVPKEEKADGPIIQIH